MKHGIYGYECGCRCDVCTTIKREHRQRSRKKAGRWSERPNELGTQHDNRIDTLLEILHG